MKITDEGQQENEDFDALLTQVKAYYAKHPRTTLVLSARTSTGMAGYLVHGHPEIRAGLIESLRVLNSEELYAMLTAKEQKRILTVPVLPRS